MAFPTITFKHTNSNDSRLEDLVNRKFDSLERYVGDETDVRCEVEFQKEAPRQSGKLFRVEANIWLRGTLFRAEDTNDSFEKAVDAVRSELDAEMRKAHDKRGSVMRRSGRKMKEFLRWGR